MGKHTKTLLSKPLLFFLVTFIFCQLLQAQSTNDSLEKRINQLIGQLTLQEKIKLLGGTGFGTQAIERLGIPSILMCDGPAGVRWGESTSFPAPIALASSWNKELMFNIGEAMALEVKKKNRNCLLSPCVNMHRFPIGGRNFESYGEDPFLAGKLAAAYIRGLQSKRVIACVKHFACNNQEWKRSSVDVKVDLKTLHEYYFPAFKYAIKEGNAWSVMSAYNKINAVYTGENRYLIHEVLKKQWGFEGFVVSDWGSVFSPVQTALDGVDLEMPFAMALHDSVLMPAIEKKAIPLNVIDNKVKCLLRIMFKAGLFDAKMGYTVNDKDNTMIRQVTRKAATEGIVLLKNENKLLPLKNSKAKRIAFIGPNAAYARTGGGGSSKVTPSYAVSPLEGFRALCPKSMEVSYALGCTIEKDIRIIDPPYFSSSSSPAEPGSGLKAEYFNNTQLSGSALITRIDQNINYFWCYDAPDLQLHGADDNSYFSVRWSGYIDIPKTGEYIFQIMHNDGVRIYMDNKLIGDWWKNNSKTKTDSLRYIFSKTGKHAFRLEYFNDGGVSEMKLGWKIPGEDLMKEAVELARKSDIAVVCIGLSDHYESEARDREFLKLEQQERLISEIRRVNPNTIVAVISGTPVMMRDWADKVPVILQTWYGGQEAGNALADILLGNISPSGKLPCTFYSAIDDSPGFSDYKNPFLVSNYEEGVFVGYRHVDKHNIPVMFPFGHGLSYSDFSYKDLSISKSGDSAIVTVSILNTGKTNAAEVVQLYVGSREDLPNEPVKQLKGFEKVVLNSGESESVSFKLCKDDFSFARCIDKEFDLLSNTFK